MDTAELEKEYSLMNAVARRFLTILKEQIEELVTRNGIVLGVPIDGRVKEWGSISGKIVRKALKINSVADLDDLVGLRVILLFKRDISKACEVISEKFRVLNADDAFTRLQVDQFGYQSYHLLVKLRDDWLEVPTLEAVGSMKAEIQVRTLSQHIWAAASHHLQYKQESSVPAPVRRTINSVAALLETVDSEFERVLKERETYVQSLEITTSMELLNVDSLVKLLDKLLPAANKDEGYEDYDWLLQGLIYVGIKTVPQLRELIYRNYTDLMRMNALSAKLRLAEEQIGQAELDRREKRRAKQGAYYTHLGLVATAVQIEAFEKWGEYIHTAISEGKMPRFRPIQE